MWIAISNAIGSRQLVGGGPGPGPGPGYTPPLDLYPADIAYSVRKLSSSYSGFCMEVQRVSDSATQDIGFDSDGLVDVGELAAFDDGTGLRVRTWYDQTGNGRHAQTTVAGDMSYIYSSGAVEQSNGVPVVNPRGSTDGFYPITGTYSTAANNTVFAVLSAGNTNGSYLFGRGAFGSSGLLMAGIACPTSGCTSGVDFGFGTTQYYRDGAYYGGTGTGLTRDDFAQSSISSQRIYGVGFTQSGLNAINMGRAGNTSIYATQELIVYFSDQLGTTPRQALEQNLNSYYQSSNLPDYTSGFLADYPDAAVAYSVRKLSNTAVKCMRVRRAVAPFDEKDIGFTAGGDLDEAAIVAFGGSDVLTVSAWYDQSGQSNHATQITPGSQPQIYDGTAVLTENGKPFLKFRGGNGGNESLSMGSSVTCETIFSVVANDTAGFLAYYLYTTGSNLGFYSGGTFGVSVNGPGVLAGASIASISGTVTGQTLLYNDHNGTGWEVGQDGGTASQAIATSNKTINQVVRPSTNLQVEKFQECIIWDSDNSSNRTGIETNINDYFEIIVNDEAATSGFLFDYPNAAGAYSVRQLNNNAEFAMQVRRSDGRTKNIGFDGNGDLDTQAISTFGGSDELFISRWYDQTGGQNHSISSGASLLIYDGTSVLTKNGKPIGQVHATSGASSANIGMTNSTGLSFTHSLYSVMQRPNAPSSLNMFGTTNSSVTALYQERAGNLTYGPGWTSFGIYTYSTVSNQPRLYSYIRKNGTDGECFNDGVSQGTTTAMNSSIQVDIESVRCDRNSNAVQADCGGLQEFISYPDDRTAVGDNANILANIKAYFTGIP